MSAVTRATLATALAAAALLPGGCSSGAWTRTAGGVTLSAGPLPLPAHRAVERVTLRVRGREFEFVGYRTCDPATGEIRAQLLLESGISALDVRVLGAEGRRIAGSVFEAIPHFAETAMADLRRTWGSQSVFGVRTPATGLRVSPWNAMSLKAGPTTMPAFPLGDGSWLAIAARADPQDPQVTTVLDGDLVPVAQIRYSDFDDDGVPREIRLSDFRDGHTVDVEVEEVRVVEEPAR